MAFRQSDLPFPRDALAPLISVETLDFHYGKHHAAYVSKLNSLIPGTPFENESLEQIIRKADPEVHAAIANNAGQTWNHAFYWHCLSPKRGTVPSGALAAAISDKFGSLNGFHDAFIQASINLFGSGWSWLVKNSDGSLAIATTSNAGCPLAQGQTPLLTCDVWEHAYYIDQRNNRAKYAEAFWELIHWDFVARNFSGPGFRY